MPLSRLPRAFVALALAGSLGACDTPSILSERIMGTPVIVALPLASAASFVALERSLFDVVYSFISGNDCSVVNIERRGEYCRTDAVEQPTPFCTRSLGDVDCWTVTNPYGAQQPVADRPARVERQRRAWMFSPF
jgi:hypothetical protein